MVVSLLYFPWAPGRPQEGRWDTLHSRTLTKNHYFIAALLTSQKRPQVCLVEGSTLLEIRTFFLNKKKIFYVYWLYFINSHGNVTLVEIAYEEESIAHFWYFERQEFNVASDFFFNWNCFQNALKLHNLLYSRKSFQILGASELTNNFIIKFYAQGSNFVIYLGYIKKSPTVQDKGNNGLVSDESE